MTTPQPVPTRALMRWSIGLGRTLVKTLIWAMAFTVLATIARLVSPLVIRYGIDHGIDAGDRGIIARATVVFSLVLIVQYFAQRVAQYGVALLGERYLKIIRSTVFRHLMHLDMGFYGRSKAGVLVSRMTNDIESMQEFVEEGAVTIVINLLTLVGVAVTLALIDVTAALHVFALIGVVILASWIFQKVAGRAYREVREQIGRVLGSLQEGITGVRVVQAFTREEEQAGSFGVVNEAYFDANMNTARAVAWYFPLVAFMRVAGYAVILYFDGRRVIAGDMSFGTLVSLLIYLDWFFQPIVNLSTTWNQMQSAGAALSKLYRLVDTAPKVRDAPDAIDLPDEVAGEISFTNVSFSYTAGTPVVEDVTLLIPAGQRVAVVGETGAGKSTLARLALRFYDPDVGVVRLDGHDLRTVTIESRARHIALIPQEGFLFNGTLRENLRYARPEASDDDLWAVCEVIGIDDWVRTLPERLDTLVRERGSRFSAGERQLVALARALLVDPAAIVLDEATANLDPETEARVERALGTLLTNRTAIVIAHRLRSAETADRVIMVDGGSVIADGTHEELVGTSPPYAELVSVWERGIAR